MYVQTIQETYVNHRWNTVHVRRKNVFKCDECGDQFQLGYKAAHVTSGALTFCPKPKDCNKRSRSSGKLAQKWKQTKLEKHGVEYSSQVRGAAEKMVATRLLRTGAKSPSEATSTSNVKFKQTMLKRHGVEHPSLSSEVKKKKRATYQERYGVNNPFSVGSPFRLSSEQLSIAGQKGYRSTARDDGWIISKPERVLVRFLSEKFGNVDKQVPIDHGTKKPWLIDAYVRALDTFVQLDGEFWHGLDKPYEELHPKGRAAFDADRTQDEWFRTHGHRLVRVTDKELTACHQSNDWSDIVARLGG